MVFSGNVSDVATLHIYHWVLPCNPGWPQMCICYFSYYCDKNPGESKLRARGYSVHSLREYNPSWWGSMAEFMWVESGAENSLGFAVPLKTISRWYGSQMRPSISFILGFEPYMCPLDTMPQRFQNLLTVLPAGDQFKYTILGGCILCLNHYSIPDWSWASR